MYFCASCACLVPSEAGEGIGYPGAGVMDGGGPPYEYLESNSSPWKSSPCSVLNIHFKLKMQSLIKNDQSQQNRQR